MKHQIGGTRWPCGNILVQTNCLDITMVWKTSCRDVATRVGRFALHIIIFAWTLGGQLPPPLPSSNDAPVLVVVVVVVAAATMNTVLYLCFNWSTCQELLSSPPKSELLENLWNTTFSKSNVFFLCHSNIGMSLNGFWLFEHLPNSFSSVDKL